MGDVLENVETLMRDMEASAHKVADAFGAELDYSDASIRTVEIILGELHREYSKTKNDEGLRGIALFFAAYIGEVIRRKGRGGTWSRSHPDFGPDSFPFTWNGSELFPYAWCQKRIFDGKQDNVWSKY